MRILVAGDFHGNLFHASKMFDVARDHGCESIVQLGDFGLWPGTDGIRFRRRIGKKAAQLNIGLYFVEGNHEDFPQLYRCRRFVNGFRVVEPTVGDQAHVLHIPRGHAFTWSDVRLKGVGGAVSVDRHLRTPGKTWWPQEAITEQDLQRSRQTGQADILFTHDAPTNVPMKLLPDLQSDAHRQLMDEIAGHTQPKLWLHGHYHNFMIYQHKSSTTVVGLECDGMKHSYAILDLATRKLHLPTADQHLDF